MCAGAQTLPIAKGKILNEFGGHRKGTQSRSLAQQAVKARFERLLDHRDLTFNLERILAMLYTIAVVLVILWLLGLVTSYTMGGFIHILLVIAIVSILVNVISGRRSG